MILLAPRGKPRTKRRSMSELIEIEKGDTIALKDGRSVRVLSVYRPAGTIVRVDCIDDGDPNAMRFAAFSKDIARILKKAVRIKVKEQDKLPEGLKGNKDVETLEKVKEEVATRNKQTTTSAEHAHAAQKGDKK